MTLTPHPVLCTQMHSKRRRRMQKKKCAKRTILLDTHEPTDIKISSAADAASVSSSVPSLDCLSSTGQTAPASTQVDGQQPAPAQDLAQPQTGNDTKTSNHVDRRRGKKAPAAFLRTSWKPGQSGNPVGRNIRNAIELSREIIDMMREPVRDGSHKTRLHAILAKQFQLAMGGDHKAVEFLANRAFGKEVALLAVKSDGALPAGVGMQAILQIMRDSGDETARAIADSAEAARVVDVESREVAPPLSVTHDSAMINAERSEAESAHNSEIVVSACNHNTDHVTYDVLCDVANAGGATQARDPGVEGYLTDGVAPLAPSPSE